MVLSAMPNTLDWSASNETSWVNYPVFLATLKGLTQLGPDLAVQPALALSWEVSTPAPDQPQAYTFHLREDVKWSTGAPLRAEDFVVGWRRALVGAEGGELADLAGADEVLRLKSAGASTTELERALATVGVRAADAHTLEVRLARPRSYFLARMANVYVFFPAPSADLAGKTPAQVREYFETPSAGHPAALGPFRVESWDRAAETIRLARNPSSSFAPALRGPERAIESVKLQTSEVSRALFDQGQADFVVVDDAAGVRAGMAGMATAPLMSTFFMVMNVRRPPLDDVAVRRAIVQALDRRALLDRLLPGARPARTLVAPGRTGAMSATDIAALPSFDRAAAARAVHAASGMHPLTLLFDGSPGLVPQAAIARRIAEQLATVGLTVTLDEHAADYAERRRAGNWDLCLRRIGADYAHPNTFLTVFKSTGTHATGWETIEGGAAIGRFEAQLASLDAQDASHGLPSYAPAERMLLGEHVVVVPIYHPDRYFRVQAGVTGLGVDPFNFVSIAAARARGGR